MVLWQEEAYTRTDENGDPITFVSLRHALKKNGCLRGLFRNNTSSDNRGVQDGIS